jgi:hypothetical protein
MAINTTRWSPDTCKCVIEYQWDTEVPQEQRTHTISKVIARCNHHAQHTDNHKHYSVLLEENPRKNKVMAALIERFPALTIIDSKGNTVLNHNLLSWKYDSNRLLQITLPTLTQNEKQTIRDWCDTNIGVNKVRIT